MKAYGDLEKCNLTLEDQSSMISAADMTLEEAIRRDRVDVIRSLHQQGKDILILTFKKMNYTTSSLVYAATCSRERVCGFYLETFPDIDRDQLHDAFFIALQDEHIALCFLFLKFGVDIVHYISTIGGEYAIHRAAAVGAVRSLQFLLEHGANINCQCKFFQQTPLIVATLNGRHEAVTFLLQHGADREVKDRHAYRFGCLSCYAEYGYHVTHLGYGDGIRDILALYEFDFPFNPVLEDGRSKAVYDAVSPNIPPIILMRILFAAGYSFSKLYDAKNYCPVVDKLVELVSEQAFCATPTIIQDLIYALLESTFVDRDYILNEMLRYNLRRHPRHPSVLACLLRTDLEMVDFNLIKKFFHEMITSGQEAYLVHAIPLFLQYKMLVNTELNENRDHALLCVCSHSLSPKWRLKVSRLLLNAGADILSENQEVLKAIIRMELDMSIEENREYVDMIQNAAAVATAEAAAAEANEEAPQDDGEMMTSNKRKRSFELL